MLTLRPGCECCDCDLPATSAEARICSFECTFCAACAQKMNHICPNCNGELLPRPRRPQAKLAQYPASTQRVYKGRQDIQSKQTKQTMPPDPEQTIS